VIKEGNQIQGR